MHIIIIRMPTSKYGQRNSCRYTCSLAVPYLYSPLAPLLNYLITPLIPLVDT